MKTVQLAFLFFSILQGTYVHAQKEITASAVLISKNDFIKSPYTGYTRKHWIEITEKIIAGELLHLNAITGMPEPAVPPQDSAFEKLRWKSPAEIGKRVLERMMLSVIIYTKATGKDFVPGYKGSISSPFIKAIIRGTDPNDSNYWGDPLENDQVGSTFAMAAYIEPQRYWDPLTQVQKDNLLRYLKKLAYVKTYDNNHYYFHMAPVALLDKYGYESNREQLTKMYERLMGWYRGDGWFLDGNNRTFDYYNLWAFQLFNQVLYKYDSKWREQFGERVIFYVNGTRYRKPAAAKVKITKTGNELTVYFEGRTYHIRLPF